LFNSSPPDSEWNMPAPPPSETSSTGPALQALHVSTEQLNRRCRPEEFSFRTTAEIAEGADVIAQERALAAIELGVRIDSWSHNVRDGPGSGVTPPSARCWSELPLHGPSRATGATSIASTISSVRERCACQPVGQPN
jgi:hypothetical protein